MIIFPRPSVPFLEDRCYICRFLNIRKRLAAYELAEKFTYAESTKLSEFCFITFFSTLSCLQVLSFLISFSKWILDPLLEYLIAMTLGCILYFTIVFISGFVTHHQYEQHFDFVECWDFGLDLRKMWNQSFFQMILLCRNFLTVFQSFIMFDVFFI